MIEKRLLILWFALAFVVWNGVYDMRMHDTVRGFLLETTLAQAGLGRGVDMRDVPAPRPRRRHRLLDRLVARRLPRRASSRCGPIEDTSSALR